MISFKVVVLIVLGATCAYACTGIVKQLKETLTSGEWRDLRGAALRRSSPKTFWFGVSVLGLYGASMAASVCLCAAAVVLGNLGQPG